MLIREIDHKGPFSINCDRNQKLIPDAISSQITDY